MMRTSQSGKLTILLVTTAVAAFIVMLAATTPMAYAGVDGDGNKNKAEEESAASIADCDKNYVKYAGLKCIPIAIVPKIEFNVATEGNLRGVEVTELHTYTSVQGVDGIQYGETKGVIKTKDRNEGVTFTGYGMGYTTEGGKMAYAGSVFFKTLSKGRLDFLNNIFAVFENDVDDSGNIIIRAWDWK